MRKEKLTRVDEKFIERIRNAARLRIKNDVDKKLRGDRELTRMMTRCPSFPNIEKELSSIPKQEDLDKMEKDLI